MKYEKTSKNIDIDTVNNFSDEWKRYDQSHLSDAELKSIFDDYFSIFPWDVLSKDAIGFDMGCGTGRWAKFVAPKVGLLHCIDPSDAIDVAKKVLKDNTNIAFHKASTEINVLQERSQDFGYSLGVLHHLPDTLVGIKSCVSLLKTNAPFLLYLYYSFDNKPRWYKIIWKVTDFFRILISNLNTKYINIISNIIAALIYYPLSRLSLLLSILGVEVKNIPLNYYKKHSFYVMRNDARDRFGTPLERRYSKKEIEIMMINAGLHDIKFSNRMPYWCAVGKRKY